MAEHIAFGAAAEAAAAAHLESLGWRVVARNWRCRFGELDIVAEDGAVVVFVEVKARASSSGPLPEEAVDRFKRAKLTRAAGAFLQANGWHERPARFDVAAVTPAGVRLIRAAFEAEP